MDTKVFWENEINKIISLLTKGMKQFEIAKLYNVKRQRVNQIIKKYNLKKYKPVSATNIKMKEREERSSKVKEFRKDADSEFKYKKYLRKKSSAKAKGIHFDIEFENIEWPLMCPLLGIQLNYSSCNKRNGYDTVTFDRIDPSKGYTLGNVVICSDRANRIKNDGTFEEHMKIANFIKEHSSNTNI